MYQRIDLMPYGPESMPRKIEGYGQGEETVVVEFTRRFVAFKDDDETKEKQVIDSDCITIRLHISQVEDFKNALDFAARECMARNMQRIDSESSPTLDLVNQVASAENLME